MRDLTFVNAIGGITIGLAASFIIMVLMTRNIYVALISIFCISAIICNLLGLIKFLNWDFGLIESTGTVVYIGLAVDYTVHVCHQYVHALSSKRKDRTRAAYK